MKAFHWNLALASAVMFAASATAGTVADVKARGTLIVGVKSDYRPYGYLDPNGSIVGLEADLAADVASRLGVKLQLVPVSAANRIQFLDQGKVDLLLATMADTEARRKQINIPRPAYYASYTSMMSLKNSKVTEWRDIRDKSICTTTGAVFNTKLTATYGPKLVAFNGPAEALNSLKMGTCEGFVYDDTLLTSLLQQSEWSDYKLALPRIDPVEWGAGVRLGDTELTDLLSKVIKEWHSSGFIVKLENKYNIPNTPFVLEMNKKP